MSKRRMGTATVTVGLGMALIGCVAPRESHSLNAPPQGESAPPNALDEFFAYHKDRGKIADMSIADIHFEPHMALLSETGEARLERYAELLALTGGTLRYDTSLRDKRLIDARIASAEVFLAQAMPGNQTVHVERGMPGGRGMGAKETIAGHAIAKQPEPRGSAYNLEGETGNR